MKKLILILLLVSPVFLIYQVIVPKTIDNKKDEMTALLEDASYKVIQYNGCNGWTNTAEFIVTKDKKPQRTIHIKFTSGAMVIQP